jgi:hypothetical protein
MYEGNTLGGVLEWEIDFHSEAELLKSLEHEIREMKCRG